MLVLELSRVREMVVFPKEDAQKKYCLVAYKWTQAAIDHIQGEVRKLAHEDQEEAKEPDAKEAKG